MPRRSMRNFGFRASPVWEKLPDAGTGKAEGRDEMHSKGGGIYDHLYRCTDIAWNIMDSFQYVYHGVVPPKFLSYTASDRKPNGIATHHVLTRLPNRYAVTPTAFPHL